MHFFPGHPITWAHGPGMLPTALADTDTSQCGERKTAVISGKFEMGRRIVRIPAGAESQVFIDSIRPNDLTGIHLPTWIPDGLKLGECLHQLRTKHFRQHLRFRLAVTVLARNRAA